MVKKSEINKKGRLAKSTLSVVLAASMVLTSSSFVWAAPVEDIAIVEEGDAAVEAVSAPVEATADVVEDAVAGPEENVGATITNATVTVDDANCIYTGKEVKPKVTVVADGKTLTENLDFKVAYKNNTYAGSYARAIVTFTGIYEDGHESITQLFTIKPMTLDSSNIKIDWETEGFVYTGDKVYPTIKDITLLGGTDVLIEEEDIVKEAYSSNYDLKSIGDQKIKLVSTNSNYVFDESIGSYSYKIEQAEFTDDNSKGSYVTVSDDNKSFYTGNPVPAEITVTDKGGNVVDPSTYDIQYFDKDGKSASTPQTDIKDDYVIDIVSNGKGNFKAGGVVTSKYSIISTSLEDAAKKATIAGKKVVFDTTNGYGCALTYTGDDQLLAKSDIVIPGLKQGSDYEVKSISGSIKEVKDAPITIELEGKNSFANHKVEIKVNVSEMIINTKDFSIVAKADKLADDQKGPNRDQMKIIIKKGDTTLVSGTDFDIYRVNPNVTTDKSEGINSSKRTVQIVGLGNYTTADITRDEKPYIEVPFTQAYGKLIEDDNVKVTIKTMKWTGKQITPAVTVEVVDKDGKVTETLRKDVDYKVTYGENINCGKKAGKVTIAGIGDYEGTREETFEIEGTDISKIFMVKANNVSTEAIKAGNGKSTPVVSFKNGASVPNDFTYTVKYYLVGEDSNKQRTETELSDTKFKTLVEDDIIAVKVTGTGKYSGEVSADYKVVEAEDIVEHVDVKDIADQVYTGKAIEPNVVVTAKDNKITFTKGKDYTVSYMSNTEVGTAYAIVAGIGAYTGEIVKSFKITGEMTQEIKVITAQERDLGNGSRTMNSNATYVKYEVAPKTTVTYTSSDEKVVTVDAQGNIKYTGLGEATITIKAAAERGYKEAVKTLTVKVGLAKPSFTPTKSSKVKKSFVVTSSTVKGSEGWEVQYSLKSNMKSSVTKTFADAGAKLSRKTITANKSNKIYYVRVRSYATVNGQKSYSAWSAVKPVVSK